MEKNGPKKQRIFAIRDPIFFDPLFPSAEICFEKDMPNAKTMTENKGRDLMVFVIEEDCVDWII